MALDLNSVGTATSNVVYGIDVKTYSRGAWVYVTGAPNAGVVLGSAVNISQGSTVERITLINSPNVTAQYIVNFGTAGRWSYPSTFPLNEWHHIGVTMDSNSVDNDPRIYLDGVYSAPTETTTPLGDLLPGTVHAVSVGRGQGGLFQLENAVVAELTMHNVILTDDEMLGLPWMTYLVRPSALMAYWPCWDWERTGPDYMISERVQEAHLTVVDTVATELHPPVRPYTSMPWGKGALFTGRTTSAGRVADRERRLTSLVDGGLIA